MKPFRSGYKASKIKWSTRKRQSIIHRNNFHPKLIPITSSEHPQLKLSKIIVVAVRKLITESLYDHFARMLIRDGSEQNRYWKQMLKSASLRCNWRARLTLRSVMSCRSRRSFKSKRGWTRLEGARRRGSAGIMTGSDRWRSWKALHHCLSSSRINTSRILYCRRLMSSARS